MDNENMMLTVSSSPHIRAKATTAGIMRDVVIALIPALIVAVIVFGAKALLIVALCVVTCVASEAITERIMHRDVTINDCSAVVTGILLAYNLPIQAPWWMCVVGSVFAIVVVKQLFGGLGHNFVNPALAGRAFLLSSWPTHMTGTAFIPLTDTVTSATPLGILKEGANLSKLPSNLDMFLGLHGVYGAIGEISALALLIGGVYLIIRKVINWRIPVIYIGTVALLSFPFGQDPIFMICSGGLMLGAIFMATDYVTSPTTATGQVIYAVGCGLMTMLIRMFGGYPEGVSYSILLMNVATPLIERFTRPRIYGYEKEKSDKKNIKSAVLHRFGVMFVYHFWHGTYGCTLSIGFSEHGCFARVPLCVGGKPCPVRHRAILVFKRKITAQCDYFYCCGNRCFSGCCDECRDSYKCEQTGRKYQPF